MPGHEDPDYVIIRAKDGFLACKSTSNVKETDKKVTTDNDQKESEQKPVDGEKHWRDMTKKELDEFAKESGIELDRRKTIKQMQEEFAEFLENE